MAITDRGTYPLSSFQINFRSSDGLQVPRFIVSIVGYAPTLVMTKSRCLGLGLNLISISQSLGLDSASTA